jgi:protein TonB
MFFYDTTHLESKRNHLLALFFAIALHVLILVAQGIRANSFNIEKQTIKVSLVAKSSLALNNENFFHSKNNLQENKNNLTKLKSTSKSTSGKTADNAIAQNSADIIPVFDAKHLNNPSPTYPEMARQRGIEGDVLLKVLVSSQGKALRVEIIKSSGSQMLDFSAQDTIKNWRFIPASLDNQAVEASVIVPISFKII